MKAQQPLCPVCHGGHKQPGTTTFTVKLGLGIIVVRDVPAQVCDLCGTDWLGNRALEVCPELVEGLQRPILIPPWSSAMPRSRYKTEADLLPDKNTINLGEFYRPGC